MSLHEKNNDLRVLLVDDDREIVESLRYAISQAGYQVFVARDGNQALAYVDVNRPDLIILDLMMPRRSGFLVMEQLCQTKESAKGCRILLAQSGNPSRT